MVEHPNDPEQNESLPQHEPRPADDFPADFFDDANDVTPVIDEPSAGPTPTHEPEPAPPPIPTPTPHRVIDSDTDTILDADPVSPTFEPIEANPTRPAPAPRRPDDSPGRPVFPVIVGLLLVGALAGAVVYNMEGSKGSTTAASTTTEAPAPAEPSKPDPTALLSNDIKEIQTDLTELTTQVMELQAKIAELPKPEPAPDLKPLQTQIAELTKSSESVAPLPKKVGDLDERIGSVDKSLGALKEEIATLHEEVKKVGEQAAVAATAKPATAAESVSASTSSGAIDEGARLYKAGKFKEASNAFLKMTESNPNDARVWYFAALSNGFATSQWTGKTADLVQKGIEREKAGTPSAAEIDAAFRDLTTANGKAWLAGYRKFAQQK